LVKGRRAASRGIAIEPLERRRVLATFTVSTLAASGPGSLRQAILDANAASGDDTIQFTQAGQIFVGSTALPAITGPLTIDGATAPGFSGKPVVQVNFQSHSGLTVAAGGNGSAIRSLSLTGASNAGLTLAASDVTVSGNVIAGNVTGVRIASSARNTVVANTISNNSNTGVELVSTTADTIGTAILPNIIRSNGSWGIYASGSLTGTKVQANQIDSNVKFGIYLSNATDLTIGSVESDTSQGNRISNDSVFRYYSTGIYASGNCSRTIIQANTVTGNGGNGVMLSSAVGLSMGYSSEIVNNRGFGLYATGDCPQSTVVDTRIAGNKLGNVYAATATGVTLLNSPLLPPTVTANTAMLAQDAPTIVITGSHFSPNVRADSVIFNLGATGTVTSATPTSLTVQFTRQPQSLGILSAIVTSTGGVSGAPVQAATVVAAPTVSQSKADLSQSATTITIRGTGFNPTAAGNTVTFNLGAAGTVTQATADSLTVRFTTKPTSLGSLTAVVTSYGGASGTPPGTPVEVANVVAAAVVTPNTADLSQSATTFAITGANFDPTSLGDTVTFNLGAKGIVTQATATSLTVQFTTRPTSLGSLTAVVTCYGGASGTPAGKPVQVATVVAAATVTKSTAKLAIDAPTITITGVNFATTAAGNAVTFNDDAAGTVTAVNASGTQLTVTFTTQPQSLGILTAIVTSYGGKSGAPVQVATVVAAPTVTQSEADLSQSATTVTIRGRGFDPTASGNTVAFNLGARGTVIQSTAVSLTVRFTTKPTSLGSLTAVVTSYGGASGSPVQVANVLAAAVVTPSTANLSQTATTFTIAGTNFDPAVPGDTVTFSLGAKGIITQATTTSLTVQFTTRPTSLGSLTAVVKCYGGDSGTPAGKPVQVATVVAAATVTKSTAKLAIDAPTITITGSSFDTTAAGNTVTFNDGAAGTVTAVNASGTQLTVTFTTQPQSLGVLTAIVTCYGGKSGAPVQVAKVVAAPTVTVSTGDLSQSATTVSIRGTGFDPTAAGNTVAFNLGAAGTVTQVNALGTQLTVTLTVTPTSLGSLTAIVTSYGGASGAPVQVANVVAAAVVTPSAANQSSADPILVIDGSGFDPIALRNTVALNLGAIGRVTLATASRLTVQLTTLPTSVGSLTAVVTSYGGASGTPAGTPVQVATVVSPPSITQNTADLSEGAGSITITGTNFYSADPSKNKVEFNLGAKGLVTRATSTSLTVRFIEQPQVGELTAVVISDGIVSTVDGSRGVPVQVATVVQGTPVIKPSVQQLAQTAEYLTIYGYGFSTKPSDNLVSLGTVVESTSHMLRIRLTSQPALGELYATVTVNGVASASTRVAEVVAQTYCYYSLQQLGPISTSEDSPSELIIWGGNFDTIHPANNKVVLSSDYGTVKHTVAFAASNYLKLNIWGTSSDVNTTGNELEAVVWANGASAVFYDQESHSYSGGVVAYIGPVQSSDSGNPVLNSSTAAVGVGSTVITLTGTGFSSTLTENHVQIATSNHMYNGTVTAASSTSLTLTLDEPLAFVFDPYVDLDESATDRLDNQNSLVAFVSVNGVDSNSTVVGEITRPASVPFVWAGADNYTINSPTATTPTPNWGELGGGLIITAVGTIKNTGDSSQQNVVFTTLIDNTSAPPYFSQWVTTGNPAMNIDGKYNSNGTNNYWLADNSTSSLPSGSYNWQFTGPVAIGTLINANTTGWENQTDNINVYWYATTQGSQLYGIQTTQGNLTFYGWVVIAYGSTQGQGSEAFVLQACLATYPDVGMYAGALIQVPATVDGHAAPNAGELIAYGTPDPLAG